MRNERPRDIPETPKFFEKPATSIAIAKHQITNDQLADFFNRKGVKTSNHEPYTSDRILANTGGITARYHAQKLGHGHSGSGNSPESSSLALAAARSVLEQRHWSASDVDTFVYCASYGTTGSRKLAFDLGIDPRKIRDIQAACSGSAFGLRHVAENVPDGQNVLLVADESDYSRKIIPPEITQENIADLKNLMFFSDGAAAQAFTNGVDFEITPIAKIHEPSDAIRMRAPKRPQTSVYIPVPYAQNFKMRGPEVAVAVRRKVIPAIVSTVQFASKNGGRIFLLPHQANGKMIWDIKRDVDKLDLDVYVGDSTVKTIGNTAGASCIAEFDHLINSRDFNLRPGDNIIYAGFGAGFAADIELLRIPQPQH